MARSFKKDVADGPNESDFSRWILYIFLAPIAAKRRGLCAKEIDPNATLLLLCSWLAKLCDDLVEIAMR